jgi:hypothetical protein
METRITVRCSPTEARQLAGLPDLLPLHELVADAFERRLIELLRRWPRQPPAAPGRPRAKRP